MRLLFFAFAAKKQFLMNNSYHTPNSPLQWFQEYSANWKLKHEIGDRNKQLELKRGVYSTILAKEGKTFPYGKKDK